MDNITVPHPVALETQRGVLSLESNGRCVAVRLHHDDIAALDKLVATTGIPRGALMRWFIVFATKALHRQHYNAEIDVRP